MKIIRWAPHQAGQMLGYFDVETPSGLRLPDWRAMRGKRGNVWIGIPNRPMIAPDGTLVLGPDGKRAYQPTLGFSSADIEQRFTAQVIEALRRDLPELFATGSAA